MLDFREQAVDRGSRHVEPGCNVTNAQASVSDLIGHGFGHSSNVPCKCLIVKGVSKPADCLSGGFWWG